MQRVVLTKRPVTALAQILTSAAKMILRMFLIWRNLTKRIPTSVPLTDGVDPQTLERDGSGHPNDEMPGIDLPGRMERLYSLANVPKSWPLARLTIPLSAASKHLERLLEGYYMEVLVTNTNPDSQLHFVRFAKDLVVVFAFHLAETISALFRHVLDHPSKVLYDPETEPLFLPLFWFYPIYREMLNSASRHRPSKSMELRRAASGLVKVICRTEESRPGGKGLKPGKQKKKGLLASFGDWFGSINMMNILYVWFPASWGPSVVEAIRKRNVTCLAKKPMVRDPHIFDRKEAAMGSRSREVTCRIQKWNIQADGFHPILVANARVDWLALKDHEASWRLHPVDDSRSASCLPDLIHSTYVLVMPGLLNEMAHRPHGLLEVTQGDICHVRATVLPPRINLFFFLLYAAWVRSRAERTSVSYTKVVSNVAWTGHNLQFTKTN